MKLEVGRDHLLFDGDCGICSYSAKIAKRMERSFIVAPYQAFSEDELRGVRLDYNRCSRAVQVVTRRGRVYAGAFAVNYFFWQRFPWALLVAAMYALPVFLLLEMIGYRLVANHRHRLSQWFGLTACAIKH